MAAYSDFIYDKANGQQDIYFYSPETTQEPFPSFDNEINKEDKDHDIDNPKIVKDLEIEKKETSEEKKSD